jgi:hypothetical protein
MPLVRYFLVIGGILLGLLLWMDRYLPKPALAAAAVDIDRSVIRIHSSHRWPSAVRFDTSMPMPHPSAVAAAEQAPQSPATTPAASLKQAYAYAPPPPAKTVEKPHRRRPLSRLSSRDTRRWYASTQPGWFSW